jgi:hypothetical protein
MAYAVTFELPGDWATYEKIVTEVGAETDPPAGLIVHTAAPTANGIRILDVWESRDAQQAFSTDRLTPARQRVGAPPAEAMNLQEFDLQHVVKA